VAADPKGSWQKSREYIAYDGTKSSTETRDGRLRIGRIPLDFFPDLSYDDRLDRWQRMRLKEIHAIERVRGS